MPKPLDIVQQKLTTRQLFKLRIRKQLEHVLLCNAHNVITCTVHVHVCCVCLTESTPRQLLNCFAQTTSTVTACNVHNGIGDRSLGQDSQRREEKGKTDILQTEKLPETKLLIRHKRGREQRTNSKQNQQDGREHNASATAFAFGGFGV